MNRDQLSLGTGIRDQRRDQLSLGSGRRDHLSIGTMGRDTGRDQFSPGRDQFGPGTKGWDQHGLAACEHGRGLVACRGFSLGRGRCFGRSSLL